jgi:putative transposase
MRLAPQETRTYFITAVTAQRQPHFRHATAAGLLQQTLFDYRNQGKYLLHAFVIMPDHLHVLLTPASDVSLEKTVQFIKGGFSFRLKSRFDVWMRSFNEVQISTPAEFRTHLRYIDENPVRKRLAETPSAYAHSSASTGQMDIVPVHLRG